MKITTRFWRKIKVDTVSGCWIWIGSVHKSGYGYFFINGTMQYAHRVSWIINCGGIPDDKLVLHKKECSNKKCVNPDHLYLGTQSENMADKATVNPGIGNGRHIKFNNNEVETIRNEYSNYKEITHEGLAAKYNCGTFTIWKILNYRYPYNERCL